MFDELDPEIAKAFAQAEEPLAGDEFLAQLLQNIERARKARKWRWVAVAVAVAVLAALNLRAVLEVTAAAVRFAGDYSPAQMQMLISPAGWAVSMLIGGGVLFFLRPSRR